MSSTPILFIGPVRAGKSTIASLLAPRLALPHVSLDELRRQYYREIGYDDDLAKQIRAQGGFLAFMFYRQLFDIYSVECVIRDHPGAVIDCGAGIGPFESTEHMQRALSVFTPIPNVFMLLPSEHLDESLRILNERDIDRPVDLNFDFNAHFLQHPGYRMLAKHVVYTEGKTPEQTCEEVLEVLR